MPFSLLATIIGRSVAGLKEGSKMAPGARVGGLRIRTIIPACLPHPPAGDSPRPRSARCWRRSPMPPLDRPRLSTSPNTTASARWSTCKPAAGGAEVRLWSRLGNEKTSQFPSIVPRADQGRRPAARRPCSSTVRSSRSTTRDAGGLPAAAGTHPPHRGSATSSAASHGAAGRAHRCSISCATATTISAGCR